MYVVCVSHVKDVLLFVIDSVNSTSGWELSSDMPFAEHVQAYVSFFS